MSLLEALTVAVLGMGVVFLGLVLCILFINAFNRVARRVKWGEDGGHVPAPTPKPAELASAPAPPPAPPPQVPFVPPTPEVIAVIAATLEMEHRLYGSHTTQRLTIRRAHR